MCQLRKYFMGILPSILNLLKLLFSCKEITVAGRPLELLLSPEGTFVRGILVEEVAKARHLRFNISYTRSTSTPSNLCKTSVSQWLLTLPPTNIVIEESKDVCLWKHLQDTKEDGLCCRGWTLRGVFPSTPQSLPPAHS